MINWRSKGFAFNPVLFCNGAELLLCNDNKIIFRNEDEFWGWYFWGETWANIYGPFHSYIEAWSQLLDYCEEL